MKLARLAVGRERSKYQNGDESEAALSGDDIQAKAGMLLKIWDYAVMFPSRRMIEFQREVAMEPPEVIEPVEV